MKIFLGKNAKKKKLKNEKTKKMHNIVFAIETFTQTFLYGLQRTLLFFLFAQLQ